MLARVTRAVFTRRVPLGMRGYSGRSEGTVAQTKEFGKKERAHEEEYTRRHDAELLRKLKAEVEKKKKEIADLEAKVEKHEQTK
ncbi:hypothetical protein F5J12DRAFT_858700 [Pisolithus orientalis]|uniref:uncharacterized protein n=1 Tax=Pisolithus orientalis TaxID=936130 RepID=UPI0022259CFA|nr:uncharacterized protein F5J12DRAFT_858700 [Pisolithus orientalis]KAI5993758.1 hypothetical protein F5J12DRAFT_858700 [Pisolithus orientalis]